MIVTQASHYTSNSTHSKPENQLWKLCCVLLKKHAFLLHFLHSHAYLLVQFFLPLISTKFYLGTEQLLILLNHDIPNEGVEINIPLVLNTRTSNFPSLATLANAKSRNSLTPLIYSPFCLHL